MSKKTIAKQKFFNITCITVMNGLIKLLRFIGGQFINCFANLNLKPDEFKKNLFEKLFKVELKELTGHFTP